MIRARMVAFALLAAAASGAGVWLARPPSGLIDPFDSRLVARGEEVYAARCAACHGASLEGEADWRVRGADGMLPAPPHDPSGHTWHHTDEYLFAFVKHGPARFAPPDYVSKMPAFVGVLSDGDIRAALAFIKSRWPDDIRQRQPRS